MKGLGEKGTMKHILTSIFITCLLLLPACGEGQPYYPPATSPQPPLAPSNLNADPVSQSQVNLQWIDNSDDEDGFKIYRGANLIVTLPADSTTFQDTGLQASTSYQYKVRAYNAAGESSACSCSVKTLSLPPQLISKDASELVLTITDFEPGWVQQSAEPTTKEGAQSAYHVYFYNGNLLPLSPPVIQNTIAVYPSIEQAQQAYLSEVPKNVSLENPKIGDESFLDISIGINKRLVFRESNVVVWLWLQQDMFCDVTPYAKIIQKRISP